MQIGMWHSQRNLARLARTMYPHSKAFVGSQMSPAIATTMQALRPPHPKKQRRRRAEQEHLGHPAARAHPGQKAGKVHLRLRLGIGHTLVQLCVREQRAGRGPQLVAAHRCGVAAMGWPSVCGNLGMQHVTQAAP
eukprot:359094-Chlamydomonas_euryale.AAC.4